MSERITIHFNEENAPAYMRPLWDGARNALGFVPRSMYTMARRPDILLTFSLLCGTVYEPPAPNPLRAFWMLVRTLLESARGRRRAGLPRELKFMAAHLASMQAGCDYCRAHTAIECERLGVAFEKIRALPEFETSPLFSEAERAALRVAASSGQVPSGVRDEDFNRLGNHFDENQILELLTMLSIFGFLNRWNTTAGTEMEPAALAMARRLGI